MITRKFTKFLRELEQENNKTWFDANKKRYETDVLEPALELVASMGPGLAKISPHFEAVPKRSGGSLMRIYRDTRFSKDKTPYKTNVTMIFAHAVGRKVPSPGFYLDIRSNGITMGAGIWHPEPKVAAKIRDAIVERPADWKKAIGGAAFRKVYEMGGESLKRPPKGYDADHPLIEDLKRKDFCGFAEMKISSLYEPSFSKDVLKNYKAGAKLVEFVCDALDLDFREKK